MIFTIVFASEMVIKIIGFGFTLDYFRDKMNNFDAIIVILSIIELTLTTHSNTGISSFRTIRIFRIFRALRITKLIH